MSMSRRPDTVRPPKASTENPGARALETFLAFWPHPPLSSHDIAWYLRAFRMFGKRADFSKMLKAEAKNFDDFPNLLNALKAYHGKAENRHVREDNQKTHRSPYYEKDHQEKSGREGPEDYQESRRKDFQEIRRITQNEKALAGIPPGPEKENIRRVVHLFKGWCIEDCSALTEDRKNHSLT